MNQEEKNTIRSYNTLAEQWSKTHNDADWKKEIEYFQTLLPAGKIIEIGSGNARDAVKLTALRYDYTGTDVSSGLLEIARKRLPSEKFLHYSIYSLDKDKLGIFDGFWMNAVLLHIPRENIKKALNGVRSVLKTGAIGFISVKEGDGVEVIIEQGNKNIGRKFIYWREKDFEKVLLSNGFEIIEYWGHTFKDDNWLCYFVRVQDRKSDK